MSTNKTKMAFKNKVNMRLTLLRHPLGVFLAGLFVLCLRQRLKKLKSRKNSNKR